MINCIDCNHSISGKAKVCPNCGRPWPKDGQNPAIKFVRSCASQAFKNIFVTIYYIICIGFSGAMLGAAIKMYSLYSVNYGIEKVDLYSLVFWKKLIQLGLGHFLRNDFWGSMLIGTPTLILIMVAVITLLLLGSLAWERLTELYIKVEYKIISFRPWAKNLIKNYAPNSNLVKKQRTRFRWLLAVLIFTILVLNL